MLITFQKMAKEENHRVYVSSLESSVQCVSNF